MNRFKLFLFQNRLRIMMIFLLSIAVGIGFVYFKKNYNKQVVIEDKIESVVLDKQEESSEFCYVDIKGYVKKPGIYKFNIADDMRVNDIINLAGGLSKNADVSIINLSKKVVDEMVILIFSNEEVQSFVKTTTELENKIDGCLSSNIDSEVCINNSSDSNKVLININTASKEELMTLTGIGESRALAIIEYRNNNRFNTIFDIINIDGISETGFNKIKDYITVE